MKKIDSTSNSAALPNQNSSQQPNHAIILLASGLSRRLGEAKQLLYKNGVPLINHMLQLAVSTNPQLIIVVIPKNEASIASEVAKLSNTHLHIKTVINQTPETGMGHSLYTAIAALAQFVNDKHFNRGVVERVLIIGVDQVLLDIEHVNELLAGKHLVAASAYEPWQLLDTLAKNGHIERKVEVKNETKNPIVGLPLVIDYQLLKQWQLHISGDKGLRHLIRALSPSEISTVFNKQLSYDVDTPEQLAYAQQQGWVDK